MILAIDAGHGFGNRTPGVYDPGVIRGSIKEADVALQWALTGKFIFGELAGIPTFLTRDDPFDPSPVGRRDDMAESNGCSHFISFHVDSWTGEGRGCSVFYRDDKLFASRVLEVYLEAVKDSGLYIPSRGVKNEKETHVKRLAINDFDGQSCLIELGRIESNADVSVFTSRQVRIAFWKKLYERFDNGTI